MNTKLKGSIALIGAASILMLGTALASNASAHVAPPIGTAECTDSSVWSVTAGKTTVAKAGTDQVKETITSSAGTVTQSPLATVLVSDGQVFTYSVAGIPVGTKSVTITSTLTWGVNQSHVDTVVVNEPDGGCVVKPQACATSTYNGVSTPDALNGWANDPSSDTNPTYITDASAVDGKGEIQLTIPAGNNSKTKVTWQHGVTGTVPLAGISGLGYKDNTPTGTDFRPAYQLVVNPHTTLTFATLNWEPSNGNPPDGTTAGWVTNSNIENGLWWTTKITSGPGSQSSPAKLSVIDALWPAATVSGYGVSIGHLGGNNVNAEVNKVDDVQFLCGVTNFEPKVIVVVTTTASTAPTTTAATTTGAAATGQLPNTGAGNLPVIGGLGGLLLIIGSVLTWFLRSGRRNARHS